MAGVSGPGVESLRSWRGCASASRCWSPDRSHYAPQPFVGVKLAADVGADDALIVLERADLAEITEEELVGILDSLVALQVGSREGEASRAHGR